MNSFWQWFIGEAGAGWIIGLLGLIVGGFYFWRARERPPKVVIQELAERRLLSIHSSQREKLKVFFTDSNGIEHNIKDLEQREFAIYNNGTSDILEPIELSLEHTEQIGKEKEPRFQRLLRAVVGTDRLEEDADTEKEKEKAFQQWSIDNPECSAFPLFDDDEEQISKGVVLSLPYLNSYPIHQHYNIARLISDGKSNYRLKARVGKGWSAYLIPLRKITVLRRRLAIVLQVSSLLILLTTGFIIASPSFFQRYLGEDSLLWSRNLTSERIDNLVQECKQNRETICEQDYREYLQNLEGLGIVKRYFYMSAPSFAEIIFFGVSIITYAIIINARVLANWMAYKLLRAQPMSKFRVRE